MKTIAATKTDRFAIWVKLSPDRMKLFLGGEPASAPLETPIKRAEILAAISECISQDRVDLGVIDDVALRLSRGEKIADRRIAKGRNSAPGIDGKLLLLVKPYTGHGVPQSSESSTADLRTLHLYDNISEGQVVARVYPPKRGEAGEDVFGQPVEAPVGKEVAFSLDPSLVVEPPKSDERPYSEIRARTHGYLFQREMQLGISSEIRIGGNVDYRVGNINFIGRVSIGGDVMRGFQVRARDGIALKGTFERGTLVSADGAIEIKGPAFGDEHSLVICGKDLTLNRAQTLVGDARGTITVLEEALGCVLRTQAALLAPKGRIIGGEVLTVFGVEVGTIGNEGGTKTVVSLCTTVETTTDYALIQANIMKLEDAERLLTLHLGEFAQAPQKLARLNEEHRKKMEELLLKLSKVRGSLGHLQKKREELLVGAEYGERTRVNFLERIFAGVVVRAGKKSHIVERSIPGPATLEFEREGQSFAVTEYRPLEMKLSAHNKEETKNE